MNKKAYFLVDLLIIVYGISLLLSIVLSSYQSQSHFKEGYRQYLKRNNVYWQEVFDRVELCTKAEAC